MAGEKKREGGGGASKGWRKEREPGWLRNDFNESTESPTDTLDMTPGAGWQKKMGEEGVEE